MKKIVTILSFFIFTSFAFAQKGKLAGKVTDKATGEDIIGATILIEGTTNGATTDLDGKYFLQVAPGTYNVVVSYVSYKTKKYEGVVIKEGELTSINVSLDENSTELEEVVIQGEIKKESSAALLIQQKNAVSMSSGISADLIRRMPDRTTADVIKRVSGATIQDGKFAIIRGMQDRYNYGMINGAPLPSSEPDRKAFSLDLVPAQVIDNMIISKTATPDMPGDFAGGLIQINTRDIPDENKVFVNVGGGYHSLTTFKDFYKSPQSGGTDFLGADNGARQLPNGLLSTADAQSKTNNINDNPQQLVNQTKLFNNDFTPKLGKAMPNMSMQIGASKRAKIAGNDFGIIGAITYNNSNTYDPYERNTPRIGNIDSIPYKRDSTTQGYFYKYDRYRNNINLGGILNLTYKIGQKNKLFFKNLLTQVASDQTILRNGIIYDQALPTPFANDKDIAYFYQSNRSYFSQFGGEHILSDLRKIKLNYVIGYTNIFMQVPDFKRNFSRANAQTRSQADTANANRFINGLPFSPGSPNNPGRFFFDLKESSVSANYDVSILVNELRTSLKVGGMHQLRSREFTGRNFNFTYSDNSSIVDPKVVFGEIKQDINTIFAQDSNVTANRYYQVESTQGSDKYSASSTLHAGFVMAESKITPELKAIYGLRVESFNQKINSISQGDSVKKDRTWLDLLPSLNLIYALTEKINLRGSYSYTLSRPEFREFAPLAFYDFTRNSVFVGNPNLNRARIHNIDAKFEFYPASGQMFSVNPFIKYFNNPVENIIQPSQGGISQISYQNAKSAYIYGVEFEARTNLLFLNPTAKILENFTVFANYSQIISGVNQSNLTGIAADALNRPLQGQSPYIFNIGVQYNTEKDFNVTLTANQYGKRIAFVGQEKKFQIWEAPRFVMDFSISKTFNKRLNLRGTIGDIFAQDLIFYYNLDNSSNYSSTGDEIFEKYRRGYTVSLSVGYTF